MLKLPDHSAVRIGLNEGAEATEVCAFVVCLRLFSCSISVYLVPAFFQLTLPAKNCPALKCRDYASEMCILNIGVCKLAIIF